MAVVAARTDRRDPQPYGFCVYRREQTHKHVNGVEI